MSSSRTITLFSERPVETQRPSSFLVSIVAHGLAITIVSLGLIYTPVINEHLEGKRYTIRQIDLETPKERAREASSKGIAYPGPHSDEHNPMSGQKPAAHEAVLRQTANAVKGKQTLIQPDLPDPVKVAEETPVPTVVIWSPKKELVKKLVAPLPEKATAADVKPSMIAPNQEIDLGDLSVSSTNRPTANMPVFPATTSPMVVHGPNMVQLAPVTASQTSAQPTPTAVMSISDLRMPDGIATLPPINQTATQNESGALAPGQASAGQRSTQAQGTGATEAAGDSGEPNGVAGKGNGTRAGSGAGSGEDGLTTTQFNLPRNGEFGAVVVGASLQEKFPEMSSVWNDRVAYTVYLHVGLTKSWILQYSLPRTSEASQSGNITRLEAPWPYNIVRPNLGPDAFNSDAILVHGFVNKDGRFESLSVAFPPAFQDAQFVLDALQQWQFRPAVREGQTEKVEVLLIIPEELD
jgi:hypothetical protein